MENRVLTNVPYSIKNRSNYDISLKETKDIIDVPYFPAQNLVETKGIKVFNVLSDDKLQGVERFFLLTDKDGKERVFGILNRKDARFIFVELADNARYVQYRFGGNSFPQGRKYYSVAQEKDKIFIAFGECNNRCVNDLWVYDINRNAWENLNFSIQEKAINEAPSKRRKVNLVVLPSQIWIFGGETDILTINSQKDREIVVLNDLWLYDRSTGTWTNFDKKRILPHRPGNIVSISSKEVKIYIEGGINEIGEEEPTAIWTVNLETDEVTYEAISSQPFKPSYTNQAYFYNGKIYYKVGNKFYYWNDEEKKFVEDFEATALEPSSGAKLIVENVSAYRGGKENLGSTTITQAKVVKSDGTEVTKSITPPIATSTIPRVNIDNYQTWFMFGVDGKNRFNEGIFVLTHQTLQTDYISISEENKPTERVFPSLCYDRYRNRIWLFGGTDGTKYYNDLWYFDLNTRTWTKVLDGTEEGDKPAPRSKAGMAVVVDGKYLYLIGGYSDTESFNDFWQFDIQRKTWTKMTLTDNIPFGSQYFIFEWRDRLYLFNGEIDGIYRFYYSIKQFVKQPFVWREESYTDVVKKKIAQKEYLNTPINITLVNDTLFIWNPEVNLKVDLNSRLVTDLIKEFDLKKDLIWLDSFKGLDPVNGTVVYINVSELYPLTRNQIPNSLFSKDILDIDNSGIFFYDSIYTHKLNYYDDSGRFEIDRRTISLNKAKLLIDGEISIAGLPEEYPDVDFNNKDKVLQKTIEKVGDPTVHPYTLWFKYSKNKPPLDFYKGVRQVITDTKRKRIYLVYDSGNVVKFNPVDNTFFTYYPKFWPGSVVAYDEVKNRFFCFGGFWRDENEDGQRIPYTQHGYPCNRVENNCFTEMTHCGVITLDLSLNELNLRSIQDYLRKYKIEHIDYSITRDYLISLVEKYIDASESNKVHLNLEEVKKKIYLATKPLVDDLSTIDVVYEKGKRPISRAMMAYCKVGRKVYMFGGAQSIQLHLPPKCVPQIQNRPYTVVKPGFIEHLPEEEQEKQARLAVYYDLDREEWVEISPLPEWRYLASAIASPDGRYIYIVGGYKAEIGRNFTSTSSALTNSILVYDTYTDSYKEIKGLPSKFKGRANPILFWIDDYRLLIMYGFTSELKGDEENAFWIHRARPDAWVLDRKKGVIYKAWEDLATLGICIKDDYSNYEGEKEETKERVQYILAPIPFQQETGEITIPLFKYYLDTGEVERFDIKPTSEILHDFTYRVAISEAGLPELKENS